MRVLCTSFITAIVASSAFTPCLCFAPSTTLTARGRTFGRISRSFVQRKLAADDTEGDEEDWSDDEDEPLSKGIQSVSWLPSVVGAKNEKVSGIKEGAEMIPLFPLGGLVYTPNSEHVLNIFEPRYRQMYTDILMNGSKRFVVTMSHPTEPGRFAKTGVLFELEDLKEVSEQTADQIKYICNHRVTGRVRLDRIINPEAWETRETYLKAEGVIFDDTKTEEPKSVSKGDIYETIAAAATGATEEERALRDSFAALVDIQHELEEDVRFTRASTASLAVKPGPGEDGLWQTIRLWQNYADQRLMSRQNELQSDFQEKLQSFLKKEKGLKDEELPSAIGFQDLSPALQEEVQELQKRMAIELQPLVLESTLTMQKILEAEDHSARCKLLRHFVDAERKRLSTKKSLQGMFSSDSDAEKDVSLEASMPAEEMISDDDKDSEKETASKPRSIFTDEPDAFQ